MVKYKDEEEEGEDQVGGTGKEIVVAGLAVGRRRWWLERNGKIGRGRNEKYQKINQEKRVLENEKLEI